MTREELEMQFMNLGLPEGAARICAEDEEKNKKIAWLASYHFVHSLNKKLRFYSDAYAEMLKEKRVKTPESIALVEAGASPELVADFAYQIALEAYCHVLHQPVTLRQSMA